MKQYIVTGMTCAACQNRVEKAVSKLPQVDSVSVSLLTNSMGVEEMSVILTLSMLWYRPVMGLRLRVLL